MAQLTAAQMVARYMVNEGIPYVLGIFGHGNLQLAEALKEKDNQIRMEIKISFLICHE